MRSPKRSARDSERASGAGGRDTLSGVTAISTSVSEWFCMVNPPPTHLPETRGLGPAIRPLNIHKSSPAHEHIAG